MATTETATKERILEKAAHAGAAHAAQVAVTAERVKEQLNQVVEDSLNAARRTARRTRYAAEDLVDETTYRIKREPLRAVALVLGIGFGLGTLAGALITRAVSRKCEAEH
ncbi:MAG: hypothetical protein U0Z53_19650 [Blastocatellia bacterium]